MVAKDDPSKTPLPNLTKDNSIKTSINEENLGLMASTTSVDNIKRKSVINKMLERRESV